MIPFKVRISSTIAHAGLAFALMSAAIPALAEEVEPRQQDKQQKKVWQVALGGGVVNLPKYPGSDIEETRAVPLVNIRYKRFFVGGSPGAATPGGLGAFLHESELWTAGVVVALEGGDPREESDDPRLRGLGDLDSTVRAGMFASYHIGWLALRGSAMTDAGGNGQGTFVNFDVDATYRLSKLVLSAGPGITWADKSYMRTYFGITADQAARSMFAQYTPDSGVNRLRFRVGAQYVLTQHWGVGARIVATQLQGDAADSPIVASKSQNIYALFFNYRF